MTFREERELVCRVGRLLYDRGYVAANDGNISLLVGENRVLFTPAGVSKGRMTPDMLLLTDLSGKILEGERSPTSENKMHLEVYHRRPDVGAVVHAHPPTATAFAVCRRGMEVPYLSELVGGMGAIPCTPSFAMPSTDEVPESIRPYLAGSDSLLLANHGALAWGPGLWEAFDRLETVEHTAKILLNVQLLGGGVPLTEGETARLQSLRGMYQALWAKGKMRDKNEESSSRDPCGKCPLRPEVGDPDHPGPEPAAGGGALLHPDHRGGDV